MKNRLSKIISHFGGDVLLFAFMLCMSLASSAQYNIYFENGLKGIKDSSGKVIVPAKYDYLYPLNNSRNARFGGAGRYGMLDMATGEVLLKQEYNAVGDFYCGLAYINLNQKFGFVDVNGNVVFEPQFESAASFNDGTAEVTKNGRRYFIGVDGSEYSTRPSSDELAVKEYVPDSKRAKAPQDSGKTKVTEKATKDAKPQAKTGKASAANASNRQEAETTPAKTVAPQAKKKKRWADVAHPYLSEKTKFLEKDVNYDNLPDVSEGIFYIQEYNRSIGYSSYYGFWTIDGRCLFPPEYEGFTKERPRFDNGACVVKATGTQRPTPVILYADGTQKMLSYEWEGMTQFHDGVAMVREIKEKRVINLFYINTKGEKIWPHLANNNTKSSIVLEMRPLREGMRAYYSNPDRKWGFLDVNGNVVIKPTFKDVRDFVNGYALVILPADAFGGKPAFINKKGEVVLEVPSDASTMQYAENISDVSNGIFSVSDGYAPTKYYNLKGNTLREFPGGGSGFAAGNAFVLGEKYGEQVYVIDANFNFIGKWPFATSEFPNNKPQFNQVPWYTFNRTVVLDTEGNPVMCQPHGFMSDDHIGQFSPDGFAKATNTFVDSRDSGKQYEYVGYVDTDGLYRVVFSNTPGAGGPFNGELPGPTPVEPPIYGGNPPGEPPIILPEPGELQKINPKPVGPLGPGEEAVKYHVNVRAYPSKGGTVYGTGDYSYGDMVRVTGKPADGYRISHVESDRQGSYTDIFNKFVVKGDMDIVCYFTPEDTVRPLDKGIFEGKHSINGEVAMPIDVYLQTGDSDGNRYPEPSQGFLALTLDEKQSAVDDGHKAAFSVNVFVVPMNVLGIMEVGDKKYMRFDGGVIKYASAKLTDTSSLGMFNNPLISMMMAFDGADHGEIQPGSYRVEIIDGGLDGDMLRFGEIQRHSPKYGWISADDESFHKPLGGFFVKRVDKGLGSDFLLGTTLKKGSKHEIKWQPSEDFFGEPSLSQMFSSALGNLFRKSVEGTVLSDYDMQQFSQDLDNHLFKMK